MAIGANNLLMLPLSNYTVIYRRKLFDLQTFQNQAHIISVTGIIIYFLGTYYLYTAFLGPKVLFSARNHFFVQILQFCCYRHDETLKRQHFRVPHVAGHAPGGVQRPVFGQKMARKSDFFTLPPYNPPFLVSDGLDSMGS